MKYEGDLFIGDDFETYKSAISEMKPNLKRVWLWGTATIFYAWSGLRLNDGTMNLWGVSIEGITETRLVIVLIAFTLYFPVAYFWNFFLKCRELPEGYLQALRKKCFFDPEKNGSEVAYNLPAPKEQRKNNPMGTLCQFPKGLFFIHLVFWELFVIPRYIPALLSIFAITSILFTKAF